MPGTQAFYTDNARAFFDRTVDMDMSSLHGRFLAHLPSRASILDAGCGSGRDSAAFMACGHEVHAFDASPELAALASAHTGLDVRVCTFHDIDATNAYDGIWCCASLLHLPEAEIPLALQRLWHALRPGGVLYLSFKLGRGERTDEHGRHFTDADEALLRHWLMQLEGVQGTEFWVSSDQRPGTAQQWINALVTRSPRKVITCVRALPYVACRMK